MNNSRAVPSERVFRMSSHIIVEPDRMVEQMTMEGGVLTDFFLPDRNFSMQDNLSLE
ncbi:hypothetical protein [Kordiimonas lacus]|uniref:hypothetical protein n=1 Tax=Kordiimonas lacus TaxID=637679 RepID=UPI001F4C7E7D|nr:hypothetical protein [Kordiimonas lacus]